MLKLETPNLHELMLDRIIAYGHTWSPLHELVPEPPLRHGHAISIDMAYSATLSHMRGLLSAADHMCLLNLFSRAGLSMDHEQFDESLLEKATAAILRTRGGKLRAAVPITPMGECVFLNDVSSQEMSSALQLHKKLVMKFPRCGAGIDAYVDAGDTGYTVREQPVKTEKSGITSHEQIFEELCGNHTPATSIDYMPTSTGLNNGVGRAMDKSRRSQQIAVTVQGESGSH